MIPLSVRRAVLRRAHRECEQCGQRLPLELHHLRRYTDDAYERVPIPIDGRETPDDLAALCRDCHHGRHFDCNGDFWWDPEERDDHWLGYYHEMEKG